MVSFKPFDTKDFKLWQLIFFLKKNTNELFFEWLGCNLKCLIQPLETLANSWLDSYHYLTKHNLK